ncbi:Protein involved in high osmolarity signaling pathway [Ceraceosorus bombacis]|uniref:Protein involved in high osmolarity signaling pathway n=1 Tax=Ceraceosorus bombacis TaxID=401625 RepID=A0A0P1BJ92_9BASI|nr:Protein involved in high osmolarity signaling pathway [Ceraceosorus bombacis]
MVLGRTTQLPAALREELGLPASSKRRGRGGSFFQRDRGRTFEGHQRATQSAERSDGRHKKQDGPKVISRQTRREKGQGGPRQGQVDQSNRADSKGKAPEKASSDDRKRPRRWSEEAARVSISTQQKGVSPDRSTALERLLSKGDAASRSGKGFSEEAGDPHRGKRRKMTQQERDEEDEIAWLEAHLDGGRKKKTTSKGDTKRDDEESIGGGDDGLDDLLGELDRFYPGMYADGSDAGERDTEDEINSHNELESIAESGDGDYDDDGEAAFEGFSKYLPPAARAAAAAAVSKTSSSSSETDQRLRRQANGLLNRLAEGNLAGIVGDIEGLYRSHPRASVNNTLSDLIIANVSSPSDLIDTFLILQAALVVALHRIIGVEFAAQVLQGAVDRLLQARKEALERESQGELPSKEAANIVGLLAGMYNLGSLAHPLMYDFMRLFLSDAEAMGERRLGEADVELLLRLVKSCGAALRHDDPTALRAIVHLAQEKAAAIGEGTVVSGPQHGSAGQSETISTTRIRFMLEALSDLKNNRTKAAAALESSPAGQSLNRLRKFISSLAKTRTLRSRDALRIGLQDLKDAESRGKWWLVGAAWAGQEGNASAEGVTASRRLREDAPNKDSQESKLLILARAQGMNTEARRNIFVTIMSGEDYADASNRLLSLKLVEAQRREIIRVLLHCIGAEPHYNPYYVLIGVQLATDSPGTRVTMQYCLWDFLRSLGEKHVGGKTIVDRDASESEDEDDDVSSNAMRARKMAHLARAYGWWIAKGALGLNVLKTVSFATLKPRGARFLQLLLAHVLLSTQVSSPLQTLRIKSAPSLSKTKSLGAGDGQALEEVLVSGTVGNQDLSKGLLYFIDAHVAKKNEIAQLVGRGEEVEGTRTRLFWAASTAKEVLSVGATIRPF